MALLRNPSRSLRSSRLLSHYTIVCTTLLAVNISFEGLLLDPPDEDFVIFTVTSP